MGIQNRGTELEESTMSNTYEPDQTRQWIGHTAVDSQARRSARSRVAMNRGIPVTRESGEAEIAWSAAETCHEISQSDGQKVLVHH